MTITPDQARELLDGATPGPWDVLLLSATKEAVNVLVGEDAVQGDGECLATFDSGFGGDPEWANPEGNLPLIAAAPDLAQTIAGMTEEWGVERDRPGTAYIDGTVARWITWIGDEARARKACVISPRGGNPRLVRRLVGPVEVVE
ncbi:hypothetical protein [Corynebacterium sp.]|uniref:hypothetical protein n=1 Tax=Corynebacterium sp. TaxID=1720 RepID=UPI0028A6C8BD|nr:hypothetical protein [Corynebacterium sp.]